MSLPIELKVHREGRCRMCGWRVTVERESDGHIRSGRWCGPVETEHPFIVPDDPPAADTVDAPIVESLP